MIVALFAALAYFKYSSWYTIIAGFVTLAIGYYLGYKYKNKVWEDKDGN